MTEDAIRQLQSAGKIEDVSVAIPAPTSVEESVAVLQAQMRDYVPLLERLRNQSTLAEVSTSTDPFESFLDVIHWNSVDGFTIGGTAGNYQVWDGQLVISSNTIVNSDTHLCSTANYINICEEGKLLTVEWQIANLSHSTDFLIRLYLTDSAAAPPSDTANHFGFQIDYGPSKIYGCTGDGVAQTKTDLNTALSVGNQRTRLKAVCNRGTDVKFYINDQLVATNITNLPATSDLRLNMGIKTLIAAQRNVTLNRVLIQKQY